MTLPSQRNHPETSFEAAADPGVIARASSDRKMIVAMMSENEYGFTADEISAYVEEVDGRIFPPNQVNSRLGELRDDGLLKWVILKHTKDGKPVYWSRTTRRGRNARVNVIKSVAVKTPEIDEPYQQEEFDYE